MAFGAIVVTCHAAHAARVRRKAGIECLSCTEKQEGPTLVARKCGHDCGIVVKGAIEVFPGGHAWCDGGLAEEVECQFCLLKEQVPKIMGEDER